MLRSRTPPASAARVAPLDDPTSRPVEALSLRQSAVANRVGRFTLGASRGRRRVEQPPVGRTGLPNGSFQAEAKGWIEMARTVITGGAGFVGSHLCERFLAEGHDVVCVDNLLTGAPGTSPTSSTTLTSGSSSTTSPSRSRSTARSTTSSTSPAPPARPTTWPTRSPPSRSARSAPTTPWAWPRPRTPGSSWPAPPRSTATPTSTPSARITGATSTRSAPEAATTRPSGSPRPSRWPTTAHGVKTRIVRIFNTYGPRMRLNDGRVLPAFMGQVLRGEPMSVYGKGTRPGRSAT